MLQDIFEINFEKRAKNLFIPINGKKIIVFIDDMNMPIEVKFNIKIMKYSTNLFRILMDLNHHLN
jgi:hypothetical protein